MDLSTEVFDAAKEGWIPGQLQRVLETKTLEELRNIVGKTSNGTTALIAACKHGHLDVVQYLVEKCFADIEQVGAMIIDDQHVAAASPLWCAASSGEYAIVKYLVSKQVNVNCTTETGSTPLRASCFKGHYSIVKYLIERNADIEIANCHGHTCLMVACLQGHADIVHHLLTRGANLNRKTRKGSTALHDCAESGSLGSLEQLLGLNARIEKDVYGMTPLLTAATKGQHLKIMYCLGDYCTMGQMIETVELLGAACVDEKQNISGAVRVWKHAMQERLTNGYHKPADKEPHVAYNWAVEAQTMDDLDNLIGDPEGIRMQALLIRERILGQTNPHTSNYIMWRGLAYADMNKMERCIELWTYGLNMQQCSFPPLCDQTLHSFFLFAKLFSMMMSKETSSGEFTNCNIIIDIFDKLVMEAKRGKAAIEKTNNEELNFNRLVEIIMYMLKLLCDAEQLMSNEQVFQFNKLTYQLVKLKLEGEKGYTLMHFACTKVTSTTYRLPAWVTPALRVFELLIEVGGDVNQRDTAGNTPLHVAALERPCNGIIINTLLKAGAHVDSRNDEYQSPHQLVPPDTACELLFPHKFQSLQCLAARAVRRHNLVYENVLSPELAGFVKNH